MSRPTGKCFLCLSEHAHYRVETGASGWQWVCAKCSRIYESEETT